TMEHIDFADICSRIGDDVVAFTTMYLVNAVASLDTVVTFAAPYGVVTFAGDDVIISIGSHDHDMLVAVVSQVFRHPIVIGIAPFDHGGECLQDWIGVFGVCFTQT